MGEKLGLNVLMSAEFAFKDSPNHYLVYGIDKKFLDLYPDIVNMDIEEFSIKAKKHNLFIVQAHPYRDGTNSPTPEFADAVEAVNTNPRHENFESKCFELAKKYSLPATAGSDSHRTEDIAGCGILTETEIKTPQDYIQLIKSGNFKIFKSEE